MGWTESRSRLVAAGVLLVVASILAPACTTVRKQEGIFQATGVGVRFFGFTWPRTDYETLQDAVAKEVGLDGRITNVWRTAFLRPWYNVLYPILGVEWIEVYGTY